MAHNSTRAEEVGNKDNKGNEAYTDDSGGVQSSQ